MEFTRRPQWRRVSMGVVVSLERREQGSIKREHMTKSQTDISEEFAKQLLSALYGLDAHIGRLDEICSSLRDEAIKTRFIRALGDLVGDIDAKLMCPIYRRFPALGSPAQPGPWLEKIP